MKIYVTVVDFYFDYELRDSKNVYVGHDLDIAKEMMTINRHEIYEAKCHIEVWQYGHFVETIEEDQ